MKNIKNNKSGFTLLEILLVVAAIAILAGVVIVAVNPGKQLADARNSQRLSDVNSIASAVIQKSIDEDGVVMTAVTTTDTEICIKGGSVTATCTSLIDLSTLTTSSEYLTGIPTDPQGASTNGAGYTISKDANDRITVTAPDAENGETITITK